MEGKSHKFFKTILYVDILISFPGIIAETESLKREREKIAREKAELLKQSGAAINLPAPVPLRTATSAKAPKNERKEISMKLNSSKGKVIESKKWEVEDDEDEEDEMNEALNNVRTAVDHRSGKVQYSHRNYRK